MQLTKGCTFACLSLTCHFILFAAANASSKSHLRVYKDCVEVTRLLRSNEKFDEQDWQTIDSQNIYIHDCGKPFLLRFQHHEKGGQGQKVFLRGNETGKGDVILVDANAGLLRHKLASGETRYFYANSRSVEYKDNPLNAYSEIKVDTLDGGSCLDGATISYIQANMKWLRSHELRVNEGNSVLTTWATIVNLGRDTKKGDFVELVADDDVYSDARNRYALRSNPSTLASSDALPNEYIPEEMDLHGVKVFRVAYPLSIEGKQWLRLPLIVQNVSVERLVSATNTLSFLHETSGRFTRAYDVTLKDFIPDGRLVVRERGGRIVGRTSIQNSVLANETHRVKLGISMDIIYKRKMDRKSLVNNDTEYSLQLTLLNKAAEPINVEYVEECASMTVMECEKQEGEWNQLVCELTPRKVLIRGIIDGHSDISVHFRILARKLDPQFQQLWP